MGRKIWRGSFRSEAGEGVGVALMEGAAVVEHGRGSHGGEHGLGGGRSEEKLFGDPPLETNPVHCLPGTGAG